MHNIQENVFFNSYLDSLSHYGVAGMKWGVWNDETKRKYFGWNSKRGIDSKLSNENLDVKDSDYTDSFKSMNADIKAANLGGKLISYYKKDRAINTGYCTAAYLLRKSGYDVAAKTSNVDFTEKDVSKLYKDLKVDFEIKNAEGKHNKLSNEQRIKLENSLLSQGDGASGFLVGTYRKDTDNGRVLAYTISKGVVNVIDGQAGSSRSIDYPIQMFSSIKTLRTDDKKVDEKIAQKYVGSTELLKITDNKIDKTKVALAATAVASTALVEGSLIASSAASLSLSEIRKVITSTATNALSINNRGRSVNKSSKTFKSIKEELTSQHQEKIDQINNIISLSGRTALGGIGVTSAALMGLNIYDIMNKRRNLEKKSNTVSNEAYEKAARNYLKKHPNSTMTVAELANKYKKEWTE